MDNISAMDFISLFRTDAKFILLDDDDNELYSGKAYQALAWVIRNHQYDEHKYDIFPEDGGKWADIQDGAVVLFMTEYFEE